MGGSLPCTVELPGTVKLKQGSGKVDTTEDVSNLLQEGDFVMIEGQLFTVVNLSKPGKPKGFSVNNQWGGSDVAGVRAFGQLIKCEKKLPKAMEHARPKLKAGDS